MTLSPDTTLGAFTEPNALPYPPYINVSHLRNQDVVVVTIRALPEVREGIAIPGAQSAMYLEPDEFARLMADILCNCDAGLKEQIAAYATDPS